jgi:predicted O-methyltransferase YrrM
VFPDYFTANEVPANFERHLSQFKDKPFAFLQIGVFTGDASVWILKHVLTHPEATLVDVDTWEGSEEHSDLDFNFVEAEYDIRIKDRRIQKVKTTSDKFFQTNTQMFDFIYIDGDHTEDQVFRDGANALEFLKEGGIIAFDDYAHPPIRVAISDILDIKPMKTLESTSQQAWFVSSAAG